ncbi:hypothetical protein [Endozoicomonas sp.]|uniref:hypothetical protein n=1 Tax=Endozoicomonas sp. TaxID=1892382 RepID=UPI003D9BF49B
MSSLKKALLVASAITLSSQAFSATDGRLGQESRSIVDVNLSVSPVVRIWGLKDFSFSTPADMQQDLLEEKAFCIYSNTRSGDYTLVASVEGKKDFVLTGQRSTPGNNDDIPYFIGFKGADDEYRDLYIGELYGSNVGKKNPSPTMECNNGIANANLKVLIPADHYIQAKEGEYSQTVTLTVTPN